MTRTLRSAILSGAVMLAAERVQAQAADTARGPQPDSTMLSPAIVRTYRAERNQTVISLLYGCHGDKLQGGPVAPPLTGASWRHISGTYAAILDRVDNGLAGTLMVPHPGGIEESQVFLVASYVYAVSHGLAKP